MSTEYLWTSPGGAYRVPDAFRREFEADFPGYRIRWSLRDRNWQIEQPAGRAALPPLRIDPADDSLIRARDGFWLVMTTQPGDRMACPAIITHHPRQTCGATISLIPRRSGEVVCPVCRNSSPRRDGRVIAGFWPFDATLLERLRRSDPLRGGVQRNSADVDAANAALLAAADAARRDAGTIDAVDYRWLTGIGASSALRRQIDSTTFR